MSKDNKEETVNQGFDRDIDYKTIKKKLVKKYQDTMSEIKNLDTHATPKNRIIFNKLIYLLVACIQLRNGSRISEACAAFRKFINNTDIKNKVVVKIAKSECTKYKKGSGEKFVTPRRNRHIMFPNNWIDFDMFNEVKYHLDNIPVEKLKKRVLDYLLKYFDCNTHSLRYAFINYMLYDLKRNMNDVAKFVGHSNLDMIVRYSQLKNTNQIFDLDI